MPSCVGSALNQTLEWDVDTASFFARVRSGEPLLYMAGLEGSEFSGLEDDVPGWRTLAVLVRPLHPSMQRAWVQP